MFTGGRLRGAVNCLLLASMLVVATTASGATTATAPEKPGAENTVTRIELHQDGSATWVVHVRTRLETDAEVREYRAFQRSFRENTSRYLDPFRTRIRRVAAAAENETGRRMQTTKFLASTSIQEVPRRWGVVTYRFRWANFAATDGSRLVAGDVFAGGFYLAENDTMVVVAPTGRTLTAATPSPDERGTGEATWFGPTSFPDGRPRIVVEPTPSTTDSSASANAQRTPGATADSNLTRPAVGVTLLLALLGASLYTRRKTPAGEETTGAGDPPPESLDAPSDPAEQILTDEERVERLLKAHGGRIRQADLGERLGWSASKTSRVLSTMADEGNVEKTRLGRENVVRFVDEME